MKKCLFIILIISPLLYATSCIVNFKSVKTGQVGVKSRFGKLKPKIIEPGIKTYFAGTKIYRVDVGDRQETKVDQLTRTKDGVKLTIFTSVTFHLNPEKAFELIQRNNYKRLDISPWSYTGEVSNWAKDAISNVVSQTSSFQENNMNRKQLALKIKEALQDNVLDSVLIIDQVLVNGIKMNEELVEELNKQAVLTKQLSNVDLEIDLRRRQVELSKIKGQNEAEFNKAIQQTLTPEIFQKEELNIEGKKADANNNLNKNANTIIIREN
jgi:regulator of protease activity HflC (stomatin/prohibitin superfamily)